MGVVDAFEEIVVKHQLREWRSLKCEGVERDCVFPGIGVGEGYGRFGANLYHAALVAECQLIAVLSVFRGLDVSFKFLRKSFPERIDIFLLREHGIFRAVFSHEYQ